jgi:ATP-dependent DNA helicase RecG
LILLRANPKATAQKLAQAVGVNDKTIKRHLKTLREQGRLERVGSDKAGYWVVIEGPP